MKKYLYEKIWIYTFLIALVGLIALYSASFQNVRVSQKIFYDQLLCVIAGFAMMYILSFIDFRRYYEVSYFFYAINIGVLCAVLINGRHALGATRWFVIGGVSFQPSEFTKLFLILMLARYFSNRRPVLSFSFLNKTSIILKELLFPLLLTLIPMFLIFKQPDLGTALLMLGVFWGMLFFSGLEMKYIGSFLGGCIAIVPFMWQFLKSYQKDRLLVFLNPNIDPLGAGYTIIQSKIAIGSGQLFGKGWLSGTQNQLNFLPERHTDFIFSVIGEEWGLMGCLCLIVLYFLLINTSIDLLGQVKNKFVSLVIAGIVTIITLQVIINIGMVMGLFPIVGLTLPLVSYGRSSYVVFVLMLGFLLNVSKKKSRVF